MCKDCTAGNYCPDGASTPLPCPATRYASATNNYEAGTDCDLCPAGAFCSTGSVTPPPSTRKKTPARFAYTFLVAGNDRSSA